MRNSTVINSCLLMTTTGFCLEPMTPTGTVFHGPTAWGVSKFLTMTCKALHIRFHLRFPSWLLLSPKLLETFWEGYTQVSLCLPPAKASVISVDTTTTKSWESKQWPTPALLNSNLILQWCFILQNYLFLCSLFVPSMIKSAILTELDLRFRGRK